MNDAAPNGPVIELRGVTRGFGKGETRIEVIREANLALERAETVALIGPSGSGKSTLLHMCGLLEPAEGGEIRLNGTRADMLDDARRTALRRSTIGFVYQYHHLLPEFSALENVIIPQLIAGVSRRQATDRAHALLARVRLANRETHRPAELSGGEQQRVAIARALANNPRLLLADEPTGNLDPHTADEVFAMLAELVRDIGLAALIATHNLELTRRMTRVLSIAEGVVRPA
jgi:lipoprotein-releasing system ATP-binding protein